MKYWKILVFLVLICIYVKSFAFDIASLWPINASVIDTTSTLSNQEISEIENKISELRNKYTTEILTIIISTTSGEEIGSVATEIGQKVWVGKADKDNWVVILIAKDDRAWDIATWYWVEWVLPDLLTKKIGENNFILFKEWKFKDGIIWALNDFDKAFSWDTSIISSSNNQNSQGELDSVLVFILLFLEFPLSLFISQKFFKPMVKRGEKKKFFFHYYFPIVWVHLLLTLFFSAFLMVTIWVAIIILMGTFWENSKWGGSRWWWWWGSGGRSSWTSFGWGGFGGGWSSWKW